MAGNAEFDRNDESLDNEDEAIEMSSLDESDDEETNRLNNPYLASDVVDNRASMHHLGSDAVGSHRSPAAGHQRNSLPKWKCWIIVAVTFVILAIIAIIFPLVLTQNSDNNGGIDPERCNVSDVIPYKVSQVWTMTRDGLYQSLQESMVEHGIMVYMNCTDGYDLKNNDSATIYMANGTCIKGTLSLPFTCKSIYNDCYDIHNQTDKPTGVYTVKPHGLNENIQVQCDMTTQGGGWTVFQYRYDGSLNFYQNFVAYENGFGGVTGEFWLGLRYIHAMTSSTPTLLRVDLEAGDGATAFQTFDNFWLSEGPDYRLNFGISSGTADNSYGGLSRNKGWRFSTYDRDVDGRGRGNCAVERHGAWWYDKCTHVNLNGEYAPPGTHSTIANGYGGMVYYDFKQMESLKTSKMMFRRK